MAHLRGRGSSSNAVAPARERGGCGGRNVNKGEKWKISMGLW